MNIYLLTQEENKGYDTYDSCVVYAANIQEAIDIRPDKNTWEEIDRWDTTWATKRENVRCVLLGSKDKNIEPGIILSSFNAG